MNHIEIVPKGITVRGGEVAYTIEFRDASSSAEFSMTIDELKILNYVSTGAIIKVEEARVACDPVREADNAGA